MSPRPAPAPAEAAKIRLLLCDVDGVLTDGGLYYFGVPPREPGSSGEPATGFAVRFDVKDGLGLVLAQRAGLITGIISARSHPEAQRRAAELGVAEVHVAVDDKRKVVEQIQARRSIPPEACCFIGDDLVDLPAFAAVGLPIAVADAVPAVRDAARWVTSAPGGRGAVREVVDWLLAHREGRR